MPQTTLAGVHLEADLRGVGVQGLNHLINSHLQEYQSGHSNPLARPEVVRESAAYALIDGKRGSGQLAALLAVEVATRKARESGCAMVGVQDSHDLLIAGYYAGLIAHERLIALVFSDDIIPVVHPLGGVEPIIATNHMAIAVPRANGGPFVLGGARENFASDAKDGCAEVLTMSTLY